MISRDSVEKALAAMEYAYDCILALPPGTPGKIEAATEIRHNANKMVFEFAHKDRPISSTALRLDRINPA